MKWGNEATAPERFPEGAASVYFVKRFYPMDYPFSSKEVVDFLCTYYGPTVRAVATLDPAGQSALRQEAEQL